MTCLIDVLKNFGQFVRIRSMQVGFEGFFQEAGLLILLIKLIRKYKLQKSFKADCSMPALKQSYHKLRNTNSYFYLVLPYHRFIGIISGKVRHDLRVTGSNPGVSSSNPRVTSSNL